MTDLFSPYDLHGLELPNRIVISAMTRTRASETGVPTDLMRDYYAQRTSAGLIVTECTQVSDQGHGILRCPGFRRADQIEGWRKVTDAVHDAGGRIYVQLWHCGRVAHPEMRGGGPPVASSPLPAEGDFFLPRGRVEFPTPATAHRGDRTDRRGFCAGDAKRSGGRVARAAVGVVVDYNRKQAGHCLASQSGRKTPREQVPLLATGMQ